MTEEQDIKDLERDKVSVGVFTWTIGLMVVILMAVFAWQATRISAAEEKVVNNQLSNARIEEKLTNIDRNLGTLSDNLQKHMDNNLK